LQHRLADHLRERAAAAARPLLKHPIIALMRVSCKLIAGPPEQDRLADYQGMLQQQRTAIWTLPASPSSA